MLHANLLEETVQLAPNAHVVFLNSAADPFVAVAAQRLVDGAITLAEDNIAALGMAVKALPAFPLLPFSPSSRSDRESPGLSVKGCISRVPLRHIPFHEYIVHEQAATMDVAVLNLLYQPGNAWVHYALSLAGYALRAGGQLYVLGAKERGILSVAKRMQEYFGNVETLVIHKGQRVERAIKQGQAHALQPAHTPFLPPVFAEGRLDEGTRLLLEAVEARVTDEALDIGCGAGLIGLHIAQRATRGRVTMVDASLSAVAAARRTIAHSGLTNMEALPSDGAQAVLSRRFDLVVTNPPFHQGGIHTTSIAGRFIADAATVLRRGGRFYLVANRFLKYEAALQAHFETVSEVGGDARYKVLRGLNPRLMR